MTEQKWSGLLAACVAATAVLGTAIGLVLAGPPGTGATATKPSQETAESICQFEGAEIPDLQLATSQSDDMWVRSGETQYIFNPDSKRVEMALYGDNLLGNGEVLITLEEAQAIATEFAQKHCEYLALLTLGRSGLKGFDGYADSTATGMKAYQFEWIQAIDGALTPNRVLVSVNPGTGKVITYIGQYQPMKSPESPSVTKEEAEGVVASRLVETAKALASSDCDSSPEVSFVQEPELRIVVKGEKQILVWRITATAQTDLPWATGGQYDIDAHDGIIIAEYPLF